MKCREFAEFIAAYLSGELPADTKALFERHVSRCADCRAYLANYQQTIALGREAFDDDSPLPGDVPEDLIAAILNGRRKSS